ncbi:ATP-binding cassette domain-containing protein [Desulfosarcina sp.]|uniref:ABC transporter ATP-binding protein n=1 Tax=Desulfosarcina sp. TaxID=2027861 RepID=UPI0035671E0D
MYSSLQFEQGVSGNQDVPRIVLAYLPKKTATALQNINLRIDKGDLFGLLGSNGAGKTTLIKILCSLVLPSSGTAYINGLDVRRNPQEIKPSLGYVIGDERSFYWRLTGEQNLKFFAVLNNIPHREVDRAVTRLLDLVGLKAHRNKMFKEYSTGMKKMLAIARGLLTNPDILIMDEPTSGLDPLVARKIKNFIKGTLVNTENKTVLLASHNLAEVEQLCNRIAVLDNGKLKAEGTVEEIKATLPKHKRFVVGIENYQTALLEKLKTLTTVQHAVLKTAQPPSSGAQIEVELTHGEDQASKLMESILAMGGRITSFQESNATLEDIFSWVLLRKSA